jgi:TolA-binding protein
MRADMTAMLEELRGQISRLHSEIDETQHRLGQLSQKLDKLDARKVVGGSVGGVDSTSAASNSGASGMKVVDGLDLQNLFNQAREDHISAKYELAFQGFKTVYDKDQGGSFKELSLFWMAECLSKGGKESRAIELYEKLLKEFPQGLKRCSALFKIGMIHHEKKDESARNTVFEKLKQECPSSNEAGRAQDMLSP